MTDILAGAAVGVGQVAVGHPFDTAKVLIQNNKKWFGLPISHYYRGWRFPLFSSTVFNCTVFPIYERTIQYTGNNWMSGFISGAVVTPFVYLSDVGKIHQQTGQKVPLKKFLYSYGKFSTFYRETIAMSFYFGIYFELRNQNFHPLLAGGASGLINWTATYCIDVVRSRQIAQQITMKEAISQGNLWKGFRICAIRAVLVNSVNFWIYENVKNLIN